MLFGQEHVDRYRATDGGTDEPPGWYLNLKAQPQVLERA